MGTYKAYQTREEKRATTKPKPLASRLQELERLFTDVNNEIEERRTVRASRPATPSSVVNRGCLSLESWGWGQQGVCIQVAQCVECQ